jgi:Cytochrome C oxidase, mono-heme subunit/FixO
MTAFFEREEWHALSDGAALLGAAVCTVVGLIWAVAGKDPGIVLHGSFLVIASAVAGVYLFDHLRGKVPPVKDTGYADGVIRAGVIATGVVPESIMPGYPFLAKTELNYQDIAERMKTLREVGVPYTDEMIENAKADLERQLDPAAEGVKEFLKRYPKAQVRQFDGNPSYVSELDAVIAYLQMLGTLVDFAKFDAAGPNLR